MDPQIGRRIHIIGNSCAGKSTLGAVLAEALEISFVDLDALNWEPHWVGLHETDPARLERRIAKATSGDGWVVAGSYSEFSQRVFWGRLETVVWLDLPRRTLIRRMLKRSWRRWRSKEHLWGTNYESFWPQLMFWRGEDSLLFWILTQHQRKRRSMRAHIADERWRHIQFVRLCSPSEVSAFLRTVSAQKSPGHS